MPIIMARIMLLNIFLLCVLLSSEIFLDLLARNWLKVIEENFLIGKFYVMVLHIGDLFLLICPSYADDFIIGTAIVNRRVSYFCFVHVIKVS